MEERKVSVWSKVGNFFKKIWEPTPVILTSILVIGLILLLLDTWNVINLLPNK